MNKRQKKKLSKRYGIKKYRDYKRYLSVRKFLRECIYIWWYEGYIDPVSKYIINYNGVQNKSESEE